MLCGGFLFSSEETHFNENLIFQSYNLVTSIRYNTDIVLQFEEQHIEAKKEYYGTHKYDIHLQHQ